MREIPEEAAKGKTPPLSYRLTSTHQWSDGILVPSEGAQAGERMDVTQAKPNQNARPWPREQDVGARGRALPAGAPSRAPGIAAVSAALEPVGFTYPTPGFLERPRIDGPGSPRADPHANGDGGRASVLEVLAAMDGWAPRPSLHEVLWKSTSLEDSPTHNSAAHPPAAQRTTQLAFCPDARPVIRGRCAAHGQQRFVLAPCKKRSCPFCGPRSRANIAKRITHGVEHYWAAGARVSWQVLSLKADDDNSKKAVVDRVGSYIRWLRKRTGRNLQYAATFEVTQRGRLHVNLLCAPWKYVPQAELQEHWGAIVNVEEVEGADSIGVEMAKAPGASEGVSMGRRTKLGRYLSKLEQSVKDGRRVSYSRSWPREPVSEVKRVGDIDWSRITNDERDQFTTEKKLGEWHPVRATEYARPAWHPEHVACKCFDFAHETPPPLHHHPSTHDPSSRIDRGAP